MGDAPPSSAPPHNTPDEDDDLHTGDDERLDHLIGIHNFLEELEGEDAPTGDQFVESLESAIESCEQLHVALVETIKRERLSAPVSASSVPSATEEPKRDERWAVTVDRNGETLVTIASEFLSGKPEFTARDEETIRRAGEHLLSFIGASVFSASAPPQEER